MQTLLALISRFLLSAIFLYSGVMKLLAPQATIHHIQSAGIPYAKIAFGAAVLVEIFGGVLLLLGAKTRWTAWVLSGFLIAATYYFHRDLNQAGQTINFLKNTAILGGLLHVSAFGGGRLSLDRQ